MDFRVKAHLPSSSGVALPASELAPAPSAAPVTVRSRSLSSGLRGHISDTFVFFLFFSFIFCCSPTRTFAAAALATSAAFAASKEGKRALATPSVIALKGSTESGTAAGRINCAPRVKAELLLPLLTGAVPLVGEVPFEGEGEAEGSVPFPPTGGLTPCVGPRSPPAAGKDTPIWFGSRKYGCDDERSPAEKVPVGGVGATR